MRATLLLVVVILFAMPESLSVLTIQKKLVRGSSKLRFGKPFVAMLRADAGASTMGFMKGVPGHRVGARPAPHGTGERGTPRLGLMVYR